jgi:PKD repeat protein
LEISQIEFHLELLPGEEGRFSFLVRNDEPKTTRVKVYLSDWDRDIYGELRFHPPNTLPRSCADWISVFPTQFELKAHEIQEVRFTISVPGGVKGTYWAMIFVESSPQLIEREGVAMIAVPRFGVKVYQTPPGTATKAGRITNMKRLGLNPLSFMIEFENTGNTHLTLQGRIEIRDEMGEAVETIDLGQIPVLPGARRRIIGAAANPTKLPPGQYIALGIIDFGGDFLVGGQLNFEIKPLNLRPIGDSPDLPQDLDGDGLYEDINGDGKLAMDDVTLFGFNITSPEVQENWWAFDFDNDGDADFDDVITLKELLER